MAVGETAEQDVNLSTRALAAQALMGMACILLGGEILEKSVSLLRKRGVALSTVTELELSQSLGSTSLMATSDEPSSAD